MDDGHSRRISRRTALRTWLAGSASLTLLAISGALPGGTTLAGSTGQAGGSASAPVATMQMCMLTPEQTEGPYYIDVGLIRSDITEGKEGLPLNLTLTVLNASTCQPIQDATVEIWHCDAAGDYSGFSGASMRNTPTNDLVFLRGGQISDAAGNVTFQTIYPGWYRGRTVHIHLKVHVGGQEVHTSQLFFDDATSGAVFTSPPYAAHAGRDTMNATDSIFLAGGSQGLVALNQTDNGFSGAVTLGVQV